MYLTYKQESIQNSCFGSGLGVVKHKKTDLDDTLDLFEIRSKDLRDKVRSIVYLPDIKWAICFDLNFFFFVTKPYEFEYKRQVICLNYF